MESLKKKQLSFDVNNFMKNAHTVVWNISLRACMSNFTVKRYFLNFHKTYTAKTALTFVRNVIKTFDNNY